MPFARYMIPLKLITKTFYVLGIAMLYLLIVHIQFLGFGSAWASFRYLEQWGQRHLANLFPCDNKNNEERVCSPASWFSNSHSWKGWNCSQDNCAKTVSCWTEKSHHRSKYFLVLWISEILYVHYVEHLYKHNILSRNLYFPSKLSWMVSKQHLKLL